MPAARDGRVRQVSASLSGEWQRIEIIRAGGEQYSDIRPLVRLNVSVVVEENGRQESGSFGGGGRSGYETYLDPDYWQGAIDEALRQALVNLTSVPAPAGEMTVVLGPGWPGILLHEAIGHGLEGDFNRKKTSRLRRAFWVSAWRRPASRWWMTAPSMAAAARCRSTMKARPPIAPC